MLELWCVVPDLLLEGSEGGGDRYLGWKNGSWAFPLRRCLGFCNSLLGV